MCEIYSTMQVEPSLNSNNSDQVIWSNQAHCNLFYYIYTTIWILSK